MAGFSEWLRHRMPEIRRGHGGAQQSQRALAESLAEVGSGLSEQTIAKIESGRRGIGVTLDEAMELAYALHVAPLHLMLPLDDDELVEVVPALDPVPTRLVRAWVRGETPLPGQDEIAFRQEQPVSEEKYRTRTATIRDFADAIDRTGDTKKEHRLVGLLVAYLKEFWPDAAVPEWRTGETEAEVHDATRGDEA